MDMKLYKKICITGALAGCILTGSHISVIHADELDQVVEFQAYVVGHLADREEIRLTLDSLELAGITGAFVVSPKEMRAYPQTVKMITERGHKLIIKIPKDGDKTYRRAGDGSAADSNEAVQIQQRQADFERQTEAAQQEEVARQIETTRREEAARVQTAPHTEKAMSPVYTVRPAEPVVQKDVARQALGTETNSEFSGVTADGTQARLLYPDRSYNENAVPDWSILSLVQLSDWGLIAPDDIREIQSEPKRDLMAKMVTRAYHANKNINSEHYYEASFEIEKLMLEYDTELRNLGYDAADYAHYAKLPFDHALKIGGEVRYHYVDNSGDKPYDYPDSRLRLRLYASQPLNENWSLHAMLESEKSWFKDGYDGKLDLERVYISGRYKDFFITAGRYGELFSEGNVYDGEFSGVAVTGGNDVKVKVAAGKLRDDQNGAAVIASHSQPEYDAEAALYNFKDIKTYGRETVFSLGGTYYINNFGLGAMYLWSDKSDVGGSREGYVLGLRYKRNRSWVPGTYELFAKYYDQADTTYFAHTMVGLADSMTGFKGYGAGIYYTVAPNWVYGFEYYDLQDKYSGLRGRTWWNQMSYYF